MDDKLNQRIDGILSMIAKQDEGIQKLQAHLIHLNNMLDANATGAFNGMIQKRYRRIKKSRKSKRLPPMSRNKLMLLALDLKMDLNEIDLSFEGEKNASNTATE